MSRAAGSLKVKTRDFTGAQPGSGGGGTYAILRDYGSKERVRLCRQCGTQCRHQGLQRAIFDLLEQHDPSWLVGKNKGEDYTRKSFADGDIGADTIEGLRHLLKLSRNSTRELYDHNVMKDLNRRVYEERWSRLKEDERKEQPGQRVNSYRWK